MNLAVRSGIFYLAISSYEESQRPWGSIGTVMSRPFHGERHIEDTISTALEIDRPTIIRPAKHRARGLYTREPAKEYRVPSRLRRG